MKSLGTKANRFYDNPSSGMSDEVFPTVTLPHQMMNKSGAKPGDEVTMTLKGVIKNIHQDQYGHHVMIEAREGEADHESKSEESSET